MKKVSSTFTADGNALNIDIGFIPDYIELFELTSTAEVVYRFFRALADLATTGQFGIQDDGAGALSMCASAAAGIATYDDTNPMGVMIEDPSTGELVRTPVYGNYDATADYSSVGTARSATAIGTIIRPSTPNGCVYELHTATGTASTEPTWSTTPGINTTDTGGNVWTCRQENLVKLGGQGFTIGATLSVNSDEWAFVAEQHDQSGNFGDADGQEPVRL